MYFIEQQDQTSIYSKCRIQPYHFCNTKVGWAPATLKPSWRPNWGGIVHCWKCDQAGYSTKPPLLHGNGKPYNCLLRTEITEAQLPHQHSSDHACAENATTGMNRREVATPINEDEIDGNNRRSHRLSPVQFPGSNYSKVNDVNTLSEAEQPCRSVVTVRGGCVWVIKLLFL